MYMMSKSSQFHWLNSHTKIKDENPTWTYELPQIIDQAWMESIRPSGYILSVMPSHKEKFRWVFYEFVIFWNFKTWHCCLENPNAVDDKKNLKLKSKFT